mgnify:CR=1 FL=1
MKNFYLNGQKYCTDDEFTLLDLLYYFDYNISLLVVEYNAFISTKKDWKNINKHWPEITLMVDLQEHMHG